MLLNFSIPLSLMMLLRWSLMWIASLAHDRATSMAADFWGNNFYTENSRHRNVSIIADHRTRDHIVRIFGHIAWWRLTPSSRNFAIDILFYSETNENTLNSYTRLIGAEMSIYFSFCLAAPTPSASESKKRALGRSSSLGIIENLKRRSLQPSPLTEEIQTCHGKAKTCCYC